MSACIDNLLIANWATPFTKAPIGRKSNILDIVCESPLFCHRIGAIGLFATYDGVGQSVGGNPRVQVSAKQCAISKESTAYNGEHQPIAGRLFSFFRIAAAATRWVSEAHATNDDDD